MCLTCGVAHAAKVDILIDTTFQRGFVVLDPKGKVQGEVHCGLDNAKPVWRIAQWYSRQSLYQPDKIAHSATGIAYQSRYKELAVHPGAPDGDLVMGVNGFAEFGGKYRQWGQPWPHLYVSQRISRPGGHLGKDSPPLSRIRHVNLSVAVKLLRNVRHAGPKLNRNLHTAQFLLMFTVQNLNRHSAGYGDYYWFNLCIFDDRQAVTRPFVMADKDQGTKKGTGKLIYDIGMERFHCPPTGSGKWVTIRGDLFPDIVRGLQTAWQRGFLSSSHNLADYYIGGCVLGFEVTGLNDIAFGVRNLRVTADVAPTPKSESATAKPDRHE